MTTLTLKPQWSFRSVAGGHALTSELVHHPIAPEYAAILQALVQGVDPDTLNDEDFTRIEDLNARGFLNVDTQPDAPAWELCGANFNSVQEQFKHVTFKILDLTANTVGASVRELLLQSGMIENTEKPAITLVFTDSYQKLPTCEGTVLPIVCNRMRVSLGPLMFPWTPSVRESVLKSESYLPEPRYSLPAVFDALQRTWIATQIVQFVAQSKLRFVRRFVEYNMATQEFKSWNY